MHIEILRGAHFTCLPATQRNAGTDEHSFAQF